jgi:transcriptional regulator with XRE-family HTH domain
LSTNSAFALRGDPLHNSCMPENDAIAVERGARLKRARKAKDWTQDQLARRTGWAPDRPTGGLSPSRIANFEQGTRRIGHEEAAVFESVFQVPAAYFMVLLDHREADIIATLRGLTGRASELDPTGT